MKIGMLNVSPPFGLAPMAGMTDTAFRRLVKRKGGCGLVVSEMVSAEGLARGVDRTLEYAEYTEEERPVSIQIFGGDPAKMAVAAQLVESMGADIIDVNMGCPVPKVAKHSAGCALMRTPEHAASVVRSMTKAVKIPVSVKMRAGWNEQEINAPLLARLVEDAGASAVTVHGRTAAQAYTGSADWDLIGDVARSLAIPVFGSGDCVDARQLVDRVEAAGVSGVLVGRGALRNPWIFRQAADLSGSGIAHEVTLAERGQFLLEYLELLLMERVDEAEGFRHTAPTSAAPQVTGERTAAVERGRERWVVNKLRALGSWYTKGFDNGSHLRTAINRAESVQHLRGIIQGFFFESADAWAPHAVASDSAIHVT